MNELQQAVSVVAAAAEKIDRILTDGIQHKRLYNRDEAATYTGLGIDKIKKAIRTNSLPARQNGRDYLIEKSDLDAWIKTWGWA